MINELLAGVGVFGPLYGIVIVEAFIVGPRTRDQFARCACPHKQPYCRLDDEAEKLPQAPWRALDFDWAGRLEVAQKCLRLCKHHSACHLVAGIPMRIPGGPPKDGRLWRWDPERRIWKALEQGPDGALYVADIEPETEVLNPDFLAVAYPPEEAKTTVAAPLPAAQRRRSNLPKVDPTASSSDASE